MDPGLLYRRMREQKIAAAPISWGVCEVPGWGAQLAPARVLDDARRLGFRAIEAGPPGFLPADARAAARELDARGLRCIGGFVPTAPHAASRRAAPRPASKRTGLVHLEGTPQPVARAAPSPRRGPA